MDWISAEIRVSSMLSESSGSRMESSAKPILFFASRDIVVDIGVIAIGEARTARRGYYCKSMPSKQKCEIHRISGDLASRKDQAGKPPSEVGSKRAMLT